MKILCLAATLFCVTAVGAQETIYTNRATALRIAPSDSAAVLKTLPEKSAVQQLLRSGAWSRVQSDNLVGWVRMMHLRGGVVMVQPESSSGNSLLSSASKLLGGTSSKPTRAQSATLGIRGLTKDELQLAEPDAMALEKLQRYKAQKNDAARYANEAKLAKMPVEYSEMDAGSKAGGKS